MTNLGEIFPFGLLFAAKGFKNVAQENGYFGRYFFKWLEFFDLYVTKKDFNKPMFAKIQAKFLSFNNLKTFLQTFFNNLSHFGHAFGYQ